MTEDLKSLIAMVQQVDGFYVMTHPDNPDMVVPLVVVDGVIHAMKQDQSLRPDRFGEGVVFTGPLWRMPKKEKK